MSSTTPAEVKTLLKNTCNSLLPSSGYYDATTALPDQLLASYLDTSRSSFYAMIVKYIDAFPDAGLETAGIELFNLLKNLFLLMGRCRKLYYYDAGTYAQGTQSEPVELISSIQPGASEGTWTYFAKTFNFSGNYNHPAAVDNSNTNVVGYKCYPDASVQWNTNPVLFTKTPQIIENTISALIQSLEAVQQQITNFQNEWLNRNNTTTFWNGNPEDTSNTSNKVFWVRYWCHNNCHSNCHSNCHTNRSRR